MDIDTHVEELKLKMVALQDASYDVGFEDGIHVDDMDGDTTELAARCRELRRTIHTMIDMLVI